MSTYKEYFANYDYFVHTLLSNPSKDTDLLIKRIQELNGQEGVNIASLMTGSDGIAAEGGELKEIVKKMLYQGKPLNADNRFHMIRELGDIIFYWMVTCRALNISASEIIEENIHKLEARYPGGSFDITNSEIRKANDI